MNPTNQPSSWRHYVNGLLAAEINTLARYCDRVVQFGQLKGDQGILLEAIDNGQKSSVESIQELSSQADHTRFGVNLILLNGNLNHELDVEGLLRSLKPYLSRSTRLSIVAYNPYLRWLYKIANSVGLRSGEIPTTFITHTDLQSLTRLAGFELVRDRTVAFVPFPLFGLGNFVNSILSIIPILKWFGLASVLTLRPVVESKSPPSVSIIIPARNEKGNIEAALNRMPNFSGADIEVIFVEGHSKDGTWEEIERVIPLYTSRFKVSAYRQSGEGKNDAVRLGFSKATNELLMILDADLTMPPELLERFYNAYRSGLGDFINGSRLVYPIEGKGMKFLNRLGNVFFAKALSMVLQTKLGDSLCGTKVLSRADYTRFCKWREDFGEFDPFGDFELLFPAAILGLGVIDVPIRYRDRVYGATNIRRFYHGWMLLKMTVIGLVRVRLGRTR